MSDRTSHIRSGDPGSTDRLLELLIDRETDSLNAEGQRELAALLAAHPEVEEQVVRAVAAGAAASVPAALTSKLAASASGYFAGSSAAAAAAPAVVAKASSPWLLWSGWSVAAAAAIAIVVAFSTGYVRTQRLTKPVEGRAPAEVLSVATEIDRATDALKAGFAPGTGDFAGGYGSVVFSPSLQKGYLRISGLPLNDAKKLQYQLWVTDRTRGTFAVDAGVFDMTAECDLIVPFVPRLPIRAAEAFFVTREISGGVVVTHSPLRLSAPVGR